MFIRSLRERNSQLDTGVHNCQVLIGAKAGVREDDICSRHLAAALFFTSAKQQVFI